MRILHVIASIAPRYGGPSVACPALCRELARRGHEVSIYTTDADGRGRLDVPLDRPVMQRGVEIRYFRGWVRPHEYNLSLPLWRAMRERVEKFDVVHIYSIYGFPTAAAAHSCRTQGLPYLLHPHGSLDPFLRRRHRYRKWLYTRLLLRDTFQHAAAILFNSSEEMRLAVEWLEGELSWNGGPRPDCVVLPVGVEDEWLAPEIPGARQRFLSRYPRLAGRQLVVFFGRINFKKGLDILARAFGRLARERDDVHLVLAGPDNEGYSKQVEKWLREGGVREKATFTGLLVGEEKFAVMHAADVFVLPSYTENFGSAVAEAMACKVPVVISDQVNIWPEVKKAGAGLVVRCDPQETSQALRRLLDDPALRKAMGSQGRRLVEETMTWKVVGDQMVRVYQAMLERTATRSQVSEARVPARIAAPENTLHSHCKLCQSQHLAILYKSRKYSFPVGRCATCEFTFVLENFSEKQLRQLYNDEQGFHTFAEAMTNEKVEARHRRALKEIQTILNGNLGGEEAHPRPTLFDVGAGTGAFLKAARDAGFQVYGNEPSSVAIQVARQKYDIALSSTLIEEESRENFFDVITMWGVLEHALDPQSLLVNAFRLMKAGGVLYLYTPVWCLYDDLGFAIARLTGWRSTRMLDRRITPAHLQLLSQPVLERAVARAGFELISLERVCEYNLPVAAHLESLGVHARIRRPLTWILGRLIDSNLFFKNNMRVLCRKKTSANLSSYERQ